MINLSSIESLLITGSNGFVGRSILGELSKLAPSHLPKEIVLVSRSGLNYELPKNLEVLTTLVTQDLTSEWQFQDQASHLINLAADGSENSYSREANQSFLSIVQNLALWVSKKQSKPKVIHASSGACFGRIPLDAEVETIHNKSDFASFRIEAEEILKNAAAEAKFDLVIARLFTFSGAFYSRKISMPSLNL